jgi:hypothetical protein
MALILDVRDSAPAGPNSRPTLGGGTGLREKSRSAQHRSQQMRLKLARPAGHRAVWGVIGWCMLGKRSGKITCGKAGERTNNLVTWKARGGRSEAPA